jgi:HEAT repeat protein
MIMDRDTALRELSTGKPETQQLAARLLGRWADDEVLEALIGALKSPHRGIREAATDTLIEIGDARTVRRLVPLLRHSIPAVRNAARLLLQRLAKAAPEIIVELALDSDVRMRIFAANIMTETGDHDMARPLLEMLDDSEENVRDAAIVGLGRLGAPEAIHPLETLASGGESWTRFSAIDALSQIRTPAAVRSLLRLLAEAPPELREPIIEALGRQGSPEAVLPLVRRLGDTPLLRATLVAVLSGPLAAEALKRLAESERGVLARAIVETLREGMSSDAAASALSLLAELRVAIDGSVLVRLLSSSHRRVQRAAVRAALKLRLSEAIPLLRQLESNGDPWLAEEIRIGIADMGKERL